MYEGPSAKFTGDAATYDDVRPGYPDELYEIIASECQVDEKTEVLEIGAGTGIATEEMDAQWHAQITALEPDVDSFTFLQNRFRGRDNITLCNTSFEAYTRLKPFDLVVSATAFHWADRRTRFYRAHRSLTEEGALILFWSNFSRTDDRIFDEIQAIYKRYYPMKTFNNDIRIIQRKSIEDRKRSITKRGLFTIVRHEELYTHRMYSGPEYVKLLKTFSKNAMRPADSMALFYTKMEELITSHGGLDLPILIDLNIARKVKG